MNVECSGSNPEALRHYLASEPLPLALTAIDRRRHGFDTTYDHFLYDYVGDPFGYSFPEIHRSYQLAGDRNYDMPWISSYSYEGSLVHVRSTHRIDHAHREQDFFVVTADMNTRVTTEWHVRNVEFSGAGDSFRTDLHLSEAPVSSVTSEVSVEDSGDPLEAAANYHYHEFRRGRAEQSLARLSLTSQGCWFKPIDGREEDLAPLRELVQKVDSLYKKFGHLPVLHSFRQAEEAADIVAA